MIEGDRSDVDAAQPEPAVEADDPYHDAISHLRAWRFDQGRLAVRMARDAGAPPDPVVELLLGLADVCEGRHRIADIDLELVRNGEKADIHRLIVTPLTNSKRFGEAVEALTLIIDAIPGAISELRQRANLFGRQKMWDQAITDADKAAELSAGQDPAAQAAQIQYRILGNRVSEAVAHVDAITELPDDERLVNLMILALIRDKRLKDAASLALRFDPDLVTDPTLAGNIIQALFRVGNHARAISIGEQFVRSGIEGHSLRSHLAQAWYAGGPIETRFAKAIEHLTDGVVQSPNDVRMQSMLGDLLLRTGKTPQAIPHLAKTLELNPDLNQVRALYARALKQDGQYQLAADQFLQMTEAAPDGGGRWQRYAAGALSQAGRREEAADMFDAWVSKRREALPDSFGDGLDALWDRVDSVSIPKARLDWAWSLRSPDCTLDRPEWERRAKWGHLADHYLLDWLECRDEMVEEAMLKFADELDETEAFITEARARAPGKGCVFASAHIGAMYFGPLALELIGERSRWLASTPSVARTAYAETLISTSDQTDTQVAVSFMQALRQDYVVVIVADGAINLASPRIPFEGQEITFSQFAARAAHRTGSPSAFVAPVWRENYHLGFMLEHLPMPEPDESVDDYGQRWQDAYLDCLRRFLSLPPENLRLSGGIWRHIR